MVHLGILGWFEAIGAGVATALIVRKVAGPAECKGPAQLPAGQQPAGQLPPARVSGVVDATEGDDVEGAELAGVVDATEGDDAEGVYPHRDPHPHRRDRDGHRYAAGLAGDDLGALDLDGLGLTEAQEEEVRRRDAAVGAVDGDDVGALDLDGLGLTEAQRKATARRAAERRAAARRSAAKARKGTPARRVARRRAAVGVDRRRGRDDFDDVDEDEDEDDDELLGVAVDGEDATGAALPLRSVTEPASWKKPATWAIPVKLTDSTAALPVRFVVGDGTPPATPAAAATPPGGATPPAGATPPKAKVSGWEEANLRGWGDQVFEFTRAAGGAALNLYVPGAGTAASAAAEGLKQKVDRDTGHDANEGPYPVSALPGLVAPPGASAPDGGAAPQAPPPGATPGAAADGPPRWAVGSRAVRPDGSAIPEGATRGGVGDRQVVRGGLWAAAVDGTERQRRDGKREVLRGGYWVPADGQKNSKADAPAQPAGAARGGAAMTNTSNVSGDDLGLARPLPAKPQPQRYGATRKGNQWTWPGTAQGKANYARYTKALADWKRKNAAYRAGLATVTPQVSMLQRKLAWTQQALAELKRGQQLPDDMLRDDAAYDPDADWSDDDDMLWDDMSGPAESVEGDDTEGDDTEGDDTEGDDTEGDELAGALPDLDDIGLSREQEAEIRRRASAKRKGPQVPAKRRGPQVPAKRRGPRQDHGAAELAHLHAELVSAHHAEKRDKDHIHQLEQGVHALAHSIGVGEKVLTAQNAKLEAQILANRGHISGVEGLDDVGSVRHAQHAHRGNSHNTIALLHEEIKRAHEQRQVNHLHIQHLEAGVKGMERALSLAEELFERKNRALEARIEARRATDGLHGTEGAAGTEGAEKDDAGFGGGMMYGSGARPGYGGGRGYGRGGGYRGGYGGYAVPSYSGPIYTDPDDPYFGRYSPMYDGVYGAESDGTAGAKKDDLGAAGCDVCKHPKPAVEVPSSGSYRPIFRDDGTGGGQPN